MFTRGFRQNGMPNLSTYLVNYKLGQYVDIKANTAIQKGMPHKFYHGRTGRVFNVTPHAVGVIVNKKVGGRIIAKRVHVRVEHVVASRCREEFLNRVKSNDAAKIQAKKDGKKIVCKRNPKMPKVGFTVKKAEVLTRAPVPYDPIY
jgi:large subunit ribosomal protein L21e